MTEADNRTIYYVVGRLKAQIEVVPSLPVFKIKAVPLVWSDGQIGALPVFAKREDAERYADGAPVIEIAEQEAP